MFDRLDNINSYKEIDPNGMTDLISKFPEMMVDASKISSDVLFDFLDKPKNIVFCGMGGSAISADIASVILSKFGDIPSSVVRGYNLPHFVNTDSLVIILSYSGNTEETLSCYYQALNRTKNIVVISSGGKVLDLAIANKNVLFKIPKGLPPRASMPYLLIPIIFVINKFFIEAKLLDQVNEAYKTLVELKEKIGVNIPLKDNLAKQISSKIADKIIYIFGSEGGSDVAAYRFKCQLSENSKKNSFNNSFPELNHNEIVNLSFYNQQNITAILLRDSNESKQMQNRIEATKKILSKSKIEIAEIYSAGQSLLSKILSLCYFGDYVSLYLSILSGIDPMPVKPIDELKEELEKRK